MVAKDPQKCYHKNSSWKYKFNSLLFSGKMSSTMFSGKLSFNNFPTPYTDITNEAV